MTLEEARTLRPGDVICVRGPFGVLGPPRVVDSWDEASGIIVAVRPDALAVAIDSPLARIPYQSAVRG